MTTTGLSKNIRSVVAIAVFVFLGVIVSQDASAATVKACKSDTGRYLCASVGQTDCSSVPGCSGKQCASLDSSRCGQPTGAQYSCVAADNKYSCALSYDQCKASSACKDRSCFEVTDSNQCGKPATGQPQSACVAANNIYSCYPSQADCSNATTCGGRSCFAVSDPSQCGKTVGGSGSGSGGSTDFTLQPYGPTSFGELINSIIRWVFNLAIPVAVIFILWAGITLLTSSGKPDKVKKGQDMLKYAVIGLVVIFIGKGFISLIKSILELRP